MPAQPPCSGALCEGVCRTNCISVASDLQAWAQLMQFVSVFHAMHQATAGFEVQDPAIACCVVFWFSRSTEAYPYELDSQEWPVHDLEGPGGL